MKTVCVVIPCRNEEAFIGPCILSVLDNDYPAPLVNICVVDGMSDDETVTVAGAYAAEHERVTLLANPRQTTPYALNLGIRSVHAEVYIILSAHATLAPDYITQCLKALEEAPSTVGGVGGLMEAVYHDAKSRAVGAAMSSSFGVGNAYFRTGQREGIVDTVVFGAYRREVFDKAGCFDERLARNQDDEFNYRLQKAGYRLLLKKDIRSRYHVRTGFSRLFRQYYQYGFWKVAVNLKHGTVTTFRQLVPAAFVLFLAAGPVAGLFSFPLLVFFLAVSGIYVILSLISACRRSSGIRHILMTMVSYWILHSAYGLGYWEGIIRLGLLGQSPEKRQQLTR